jgi:hypothetical protein
MLPSTGGIHLCISLGPMKTFYFLLDTEEDTRAYKRYKNRDLLLFKYDCKSRQAALPKCPQALTQSCNLIGDAATHVWMMSSTTDSYNMSLMRARIIILGFILNLLIKIMLTFLTGQINVTCQWLKQMM